MPLVPSELVPASLKSKEVATQEYVDSSVNTIDVSYASLTGKDAFAQELGYTDYSAMQAAAVSGSTVINGGLLNTELLQADGGYITNAMIGSVIQSDNYIAGSTGWQINKNGDSEFQNGSFRGTIKAGSEITSPVIVGGLIQGARIEGSLIVSGANDLTVKTEAWTSSFDALAYQSGVEEEVSATKSGGGSTTIYLSIKSANNTNLSDYFRYRYYAITPKVTFVLNNTGLQAVNPNVRFQLRKGSTVLVDTGSSAVGSSGSGTGYTKTTNLTSVETGNSIPESPEYRYTRTVTVNFSTDFSGDSGLNVYITCNGYTYSATLEDIAENGV